MNEGALSMNYDTYLSPYSWRYGSDEMRCIWGENNKRKIWRSLWVALAEIQAEFGLVTKEQLLDLRAHREEVDVKRSLEIEAEIKHDLMAEIQAFAEQCPIGGGIIHLGATSMDIKDNADVLMVRQSLDLILERIENVLEMLCTKIETWADVPVIAYTHLQPAEPTTLGYRLAIYAQDLFFDWNQISAARGNLKGKGFKGAVGSLASYADLIGIDNLIYFEERLAEILEITFFPITSQVYPRKQDYHVAVKIAGLAAGMNKFAFDLRVLQAPAFGEIGEPFGNRQVGSSAMPFKRNPINAEKINSLARLLAQYPRLAWDNAAFSLLENTLDDSANRRTMLPEIFLIADEMLSTFSDILQGLRIDERGIQKNLDTYAPFAATERVLMATCKAGADRQSMHEHLRKLSMRAWASIERGDPNPLVDFLVRDPIVLSFIDSAKILDLINAKLHVGNVYDRCMDLVSDIRESLVKEE
jgi:adenylosuccinate lyase